MTTDKEEFSLSSCYFDNCRVYLEEDVKRFIIRLKEEIYEDDLTGWHNKRTLKHYSKIIDKLAGSKLT
jgi:hypothetical protein